MSFIWFEPCQRLSPPSKQNRVSLASSEVPVHCTHDIEASVAVGAGSSLGAGVAMAPSVAEKSSTLSTIRGVPPADASSAGLPAAADPEPSDMLTGADPPCEEKRGRLVHESSQCNP